jgi:hypothetical protein
MEIGKLPDLADPAVTSHEELVSGMAFDFNPSNAA